ncbi:trihelix transcription factor ASIL1-like [Aphis craccivora]|uniref:Trihelix transcription factor ASIL1-like n=1 Tax=Aphis craccivora TaxID=307492 RepID=A0A6G0Y7T0_APHCR|nr:trihelix transcription factor ASIL1-like [Aphis craccivora]
MSDSEVEVALLDDDSGVEYTCMMTAEEIERGNSGLKRIYKSIKDHNNKSGNGPRTWVYFNTMGFVIGSKPYMKPIATVSSTGVKNYATNNESVFNVASETLSSEPPRKNLIQIPTVDKVVLAIQQNKTIDEENRERRHREKMEQKKEALDLLSRLITALEK